MKRTKFLTEIVAAVLFLTACAQLSETPTTAADVTNAAPSEELILNDGNFYFTGDTNACYISVKDGNIRFVGTDENMRYYYFASATSYYFTKREEGLSPGPYDDYESFCESKKHGLHEEWVPYEISVLPDPISKTVVFFDPYYDASGIGPGGISMDYIDENNIGSINSDRGGIDLIFTRVPDDE